LSGSGFSEINATPTSLESIKKYVVKWREIHRRYYIVPFLEINLEISYEIAQIG